MFQPQTTMTTQPTLPSKTQTDSRGAPRFRGPLLTALLVAATGLAHADDSATLMGGIVPTTEGDRFELRWSGQSGARYRVQTRTNLDDVAGWTTVDVMRAESNAVPVRWTVPEVLRQQHFYRLAGPDAEIFTVEPAIAPPNAPVTLYVLGQCFQSNDVLRVGGVVHGGAVLSAAVSSVSLGAQPPGWQRVELVRDGLVLSFFDVFFFDPGNDPFISLQGPPAWPPAGPAQPLKHRGHVTVLKSHDDGHVTVLKNRARGHVTVLKNRDDAGSDEDPNCDMGLHPSTGEVLQQEADLAIPGRGLDFVWVRTYRSRTGGASPMGQGWTHSYDIRCAANGQDMDLWDGTGRRDTLRRGACANGVCSFSAPGMFREGALSNEVFRLTFADSGYWEFLPLDGTSAAGKIVRSVDRNGNTMRFEYAASGRLRYVIDTLDRTNTLTYNAEGRVASVTDFSGRAVTYAYVRSDLDLSGAIGDLKSVTSPSVTGTPNGNDFPSGKTTTYTYTRGFTDNRLNHNLRTAADGLRQTQFELVYASTEDPTNFDFDTVQSVWRGVDKKDIRRLALTPDPTNAFATVRCIINDFVGNVTEEFYDARHRLVRQLEFTGRANPAEPTTDTLNRPVNPLRPEDPPFFETRWEWNNDSLCSALHRPQTNRVEWVYQSDFDPGTPPRHRANLRVERRVANGDFDGDSLPDIVVCSFEHDPRFGTTEAANFTTEFAGGRYVLRAGVPLSGPQLNTSSIFLDDFIPTRTQLSSVTTILSPRGFETRSEYDAQGNLVRKASYGGQTGIGHPTWDSAYNPHGQLTALTNAADGEGRRRLDTFTYHANGPQRGYLQQAVVDAGPTGRNLTTSYEYDARGNVTRITDPRGTPTDFEVNALNQTVAKQTQGATFGERTRAELHYDAADNLVRMDEENRDGNGTLNPTNAWFTTLYEHDSRHRLTRLMEEEGIYYAYLTNEFSYDGNDQLVLTRSPAAVHGLDAFAVTQTAYDERGLRFRETRAPGSPQEFTTQCDYDGNGNGTRVSKIDSFTIKQTTHAYDGLDRRIRVTDPMGNETRYEFDRNNNLTRATTYGETNDVPGNTGNRRLSETRYAYDGLDRLVRFRPAFFDVFTGLPLGDGFQDNTIEYAPNGLVTHTTNDRGHGTTYTFDTVFFLSASVDAKSNRVDYAYDANGNVLSATETGHSDLGGPDEVFVRSFSYDALDRCVADWDNVGNTNRYAYDSRNNRVRHTDPLGFAIEGDFDSISRPTSRKGGVGGSAQQTTRFAWDAASRLVAMTDGNGNTTQYAYDSLDRLVRTTLADGTTQTNVYDGHGNLIWTRDANGTEIFSVHDALDRCVQKNIKVGPGVAGDTSVEMYQYDGLSRVVRAANNQTEVTRVHDSLGRCVREGTASAPLGFNPREYTRTFDAHGLLLAQTNPSGRIVEYAYDALDRPVSLGWRAGAGQPSAHGGDISYVGPCVARVTRANGVQTDYTRSGRVGLPNLPGDFGWGQIQRVRHAVGGTAPVIDERVFAHDRSQNKTLRALTVPFAPAVQTNRQEFQYDSLDRLVQSVTTRDGLPVQDAAYVLDPMGNRQVVIGGGMAQPYQLDPKLPQPADFQVNQYTLTPFDERQYDENGNLHQTKGGAAVDPVVRSFSYDYADRLVAVQNSAGPVAQYAYDALGRRIAKLLYAGTPPVPVTTNRYLHAGGQVIEENDGGGAVARTFVMPHVFDQKGRIANTPWTFDTTIFATLNGGGEVLFHHCDDQGSLLALTDAAGNVIERCDYADYGLPRFYNAAGELLVDPTGQPLRASPNGNPYLFHGLRWDEETGLYQTQARGGRKDMLQWLHDSLDPNTGSTLSRTYALPHVFDQQGRAYEGNNPYTLKKEEGGRHTPFHNRMLGGALPGGAIISAAVSSVSTLAGSSGGGAASASYAATGRFARCGMPNRISMNVTVPKQTQSSSFGERVNAGLHAAGGALAQGAAAIAGSTSGCVLPGSGIRITACHYPDLCNPNEADQNRLTLDVGDDALEMGASTAIRSKSHESISRLRIKRAGP